MKCQSTRFGSFEVKDESVLTFPAGLLGFHEQSRYVILDHDTEAPFKWLQSVDEPGLAFVIMDPAQFTNEYSVQLTPEALAEVKASETDALSFAVILTVPSEDPAAVTANLRGPLAINPRTRLGKQLVLTDTYPTRHPLFPPAVSQPHTPLEAAACP
ncbi:MAG TPA: flagellar assembly protein FliW [Nitrospira sp.]|nr:flagellar assembly protein FliW [Nitrospira sp.]